MQENIEGRSFQQYLTYHFNYWMASGTDWGRISVAVCWRMVALVAGGISAMFQLLVIGILTLLTLGPLADGCL